MSLQVLIRAASSFDANKPIDRCVEWLLFSHTVFVGERFFSSSGTPTMSRTDLYARDTVSWSPASSFNVGGGWLASSSMSKKNQPTQQQQQRPSRPSSIAPVPSSTTSARPPRPQGTAPQPPPEAAKMKRSSSSRSLIKSIYLPPASEVAFRELSSKYRSLSAYDLLDSGVIP